MLEMKQKLESVFAPRCVK